MDPRPPVDEKPSNEERAEALRARAAADRQARIQETDDDRRRRRQERLNIRPDETTSPQVAVMVSEAAAGLTWHDQALRVVRQYAEQMPRIHVDDFRNDLPPTEHLHGLGAVMTAAIENKWIRKARPTGDWHPEDYIARPSTASRGQGKAVWISNIYQGHKT